ncbi:Six-hairpin glycosidase-like protein [Colletotrichum phormii]|uniref:Six-hairpin glycosidase-like protein n=1 Tax=Colletotrichum phormii TaxID=359342 RepID=A0AAI9ZN17_9PEZI|nr:Six-hairpin glycosidase-like protein [Colletotrichum phormii]KAK1635000.1 Six-hairpin glycosidase-like protein [Colletotrichum phormii]
MMKVTSSRARTLCTSFALCEARSLWSSTPAAYGDSSSDTYLLKTGYLVGNGKLGAIPFGPPHAEKVNLDIDSLWAGGPFEALNYTGGNPTEPKYGALPEIRSFIFENGTGDVSPILGSGANYGGNRVLANLTVTIEGVANYTSYKRTLDLTTGVHTTKFTANAADYEITNLCSYPDQVCVYHIATTSSSAVTKGTTLPVVTIGLENQLIETDTYNVTCDSDNIRFTGVTQLGPPEGMKFDSIAKLTSESESASAFVTNCTSSGLLKVTPSPGQTTLTIVISAETNYDQKKGNPASSYSFKGQDPGPTVEKISAIASSKSYSDLLSSHIADYQTLESAFQLTLPDPLSSSTTETSTLIANYDSTTTTNGGDPYLEALLFDYGRHLLIASSRANSLPANLQGRWTEQLWPAWSADYHANINLQMNYWHADQTGLSETQGALWDYMEDTWVPRGTETAELIYNGSGWVVHNEMNVFGHTALKEGAEWANYPAAAAWMMQHVFDAYDYTRDTTWFASQGYPLIKGVAAFWLTQLQDDAFSRDGTLVVNPCNSPEIGPTTFGCAHYHQMIHQVFEYTLLGASVLPAPEDQSFLDAVSASLAKLDKGVHVATWGGLKEWKLPESAPYNSDKPSNHRHLSHLTGWYPGTSLSSFLGGYSQNATISSAVRETLISRGMGNAPDANAGWAKVWRAACWARLNETEKAYDQLRYAIDINFAANGLSMYSGTGAPFQIDANFGLSGAVLSMLVVDLPLPYASAGDEEARTVVLGPAIPARWGGGSVKGLRIRGGGVVDFGWDAEGVVKEAVVASGSRGGGKVRIVNVKGESLGEI